MITISYLDFLLKKKKKGKKKFLCILIAERFACLCGKQGEKKGSLALNLPIPCLENFLPIIPSYNFLIHTASAFAWNKQRFLFFRNGAFTEVHVMCMKIKHCCFF